MNDGRNEELESFDDNDTYTESEDEEFFQSPQKTSKILLYRRVRW